MPRYILMSIYKILLWMLPKNSFGDWLISLINFLRVHRRLPSRTLTYTNYLFKLKSSTELSDPLRVYVTDKKYMKDYVKLRGGDNIVCLQSLFLSFRQRTKLPLS